MVIQSQSKPWPSSKLQRRLAECIESRKEDQYAYIKIAGLLREGLTRSQTWPVCHVTDTATLYLALLRAILAGENPGHGKYGYYLAASGSIAWDDVYASIATALEKRGIVDDSSITTADDEILEKMGAALGCPKEIVKVQLSGR